MTRQPIDRILIDVPHHEVTVLGPGHHRRGVDAAQGSPRDAWSDHVLDTGDPSMGIPGAKSAVGTSGHREFRAEGGDGAHFVVGTGHDLLIEQPIA